MIVLSEPGQVSIGSILPNVLFDPSSNIARNEMTLPKRSTRTMVVDGRTYLRHFEFDKSGWMVIQDKDLGGQLLPAYPFPLVSAGLASRAIRFALGAGWKPGSAETPLRVGCGNDFDFQVLPPMDPSYVMTYLKVPTYRAVRTEEYGLVFEQIDVADTSAAKP